jgi:hypothetical protein
MSLVIDDVGIDYFDKNYIVEKQQRKYFDHLANIIRCFDLSNSKKMY